MKNKRLNNDTYFGTCVHGTQNSEQHFKEKMHYFNWTDLSITFLIMTSKVLFWMRLLAKEKQTKYMQYCYINKQGKQSGFTHLKFGLVAVSMTNIAHFI